MAGSSSDISQQLGASQGVLHLGVGSLANLLSLPLDGLVGFLEAGRSVDHFFFRILDNVLARLACFFVLVDAFDAFAVTFLA